MYKKIILNTTFILLCGVVHAQELINSNAENVTLRQYRNDIESSAQENAAEEFGIYVLNYNIKKNISKQFFDLLYRKNMRKACYNFIYKEDFSKRIKAKVEIDRLYNDSTDILLIPDNNISGEHVSLVLRAQDHLGLNEQQIQDFQDKALDMDHRIRSNRRVDLWDEEISFLKSKLSPIQFKVFFDIKNGKKIIESTKRVWEKLKDENLTVHIDSITECEKTNNFFAEKYMIEDVYKNHLSSKKKMLSDLNRQKPLLLKMADGLDKQRKNDITKKINSGNFVW
ncbi:MAG: hypothetical protein J5676_04220 [Bacteroidaceae bacterium]|nr:hypothetical protein [Bacteroidaceae bacterium]